MTDLAARQLAAFSLSALIDELSESRPFTQAREVRVVSHPIGSLSETKRALDVDQRLAWSSRQRVQARGSPVRSAGRVSDSGLLERPEQLDAALVALRCVRVDECPEDFREEVVTEMGFRLHPPTQERQLLELPLRVGQFGARMDIARQSA